MEQTPSRIEQAETALSECIASATAWNESCEQAAARLASAMAESGIERKEMIRRLRMLGLSRRGAAKLTSDANRAVRHREKSRQEQELAGASPVCPHCLQPLQPRDHFCPKCRGPVSAFASIDPLGQIHSAGRAYRRALSGKPRLAVLVGIWLIFGPSLLCALFGLYLCRRTLGIFDPQDPSMHVVSDGLALDLLRLALVCALVVLNSAILWKMTARWVRSHHIAS